MGSQQYSLRWNNYLRHITCAFESLRTDKDLVDVTLSCDGQKVHAHKMLLSACSSYFRDLFKENPCQHPVIIFRNVRFEDLMALVDFMYQGEVNVEQEQLASFLNTAELLQVQGLTNSGGNSSDENRGTREGVDVPPPEIQFGGNRTPEATTSYREDSPKPVATNCSRPMPSAAPPAKRRRWRGRSSSPVSVTPIVPGNESTPELQRRGNSPPVEILPMKVEAPDYVEEDEDEGMSGEEDGTLARLRDNEQLQLTKSSSSSLDNIKIEHIYGAQRDANPVDILAAVDTGDPMAAAGPSNVEGHSQDSLQANFLVPTSSGETRQCPLCGLIMAPSTSLKRHIISLHSTGESHEATCPFCQKTFKNKYTMWSHRNAEGVDLGRVVYRKLGDRFQCLMCDCSYARLLNLSRHIIAKHTQNHEGMFTCYPCQRWFKTKWSLATHNSRFHRSNIDRLPDDLSATPSSPPISDAVRNQVM